MCTFCTELPKHANSVEMPKQQMLYLPIQPSEEKEYYRFRLLWFKSPSKNDRDYPFIERYMHMHFGKDENDKWIVESQVVCPVTPHVKENWKKNGYGDAYSDCPICNFANHNFIAFKESGWKDRESAKKNKEFGRKFEACIPVYVVADPNYDGNQGKFKVIKFTDKKDYDEFKKLVTKYSHDRLVFNGKQAVDFYIRMETVEEVKNEGTPKEYRWKHNAIAQMGFTNKPYDIPAITKEAIDGFEFDEQFYTSSTKEELKEYYNTYCRKMNNDDIPDEEDIKIFKQSNASSVSVKKTNSVDESEKFANEQPTEKGESNADIDDLDGLEDFGSTSAKKSNTPKTEDKNESDDGFETTLPFDEPKDDEQKSNPSETDIDDIDSLLDGI